MNSFTYDGAATIVATFDSIAGHSYEMLSGDDNSSVPSGTASGSSFTLTITDAGGPAGQHFRILVWDTTANVFVATTMAEIGQTVSEDLPGVVFSYDGAHAASVSIPSSNPAVSYQFNVTGGDLSSLGAGTLSGTGGTLVIALTISTPSAGLESLYFELKPFTGGGDDAQYSTRVGVYGSASLVFTSFGGSPPPPVSHDGIAIAFDAGPLDATPVWTRIA